MTAPRESAVAFDCRGDALVGILHRPQQPARRGILIVVGGGPQYRVGGHRQLTLWSRRLAAEGYAVFRFDYRGMGDAHGDFRGFEDADDDIQAAADRFCQEVPELEEIVLWGECDAASAILFYAYRDARIKGAVLLNPWVRTEAGEAQAILRFYYVQRLLHPSFWKKVLSFKFNPFASAASALKLVRQSRAAGSPARGAQASVLEPSLSRDQPLPQRLLAGLTRFQGPVMLVISGRDLIAKEFDVLARQSPDWQQQLAAKPATWHSFPEADHTFSSAVQRDQVVRWGLDWLRGW